MTEGTSKRQARTALRQKNPLIIDIVIPLAIGAIAALILFAGVEWIRRASGTDSELLIEAMISSTRYFCFGVITTSATTVTLLLTLLTLSNSTQISMSEAHYKRIRVIALLDCFAFIAAAMFLLFLLDPTQMQKEVGPLWFDVMHYTYLAVSSLLGGFIIGIILMIYKTIKDMVFVMGSISPPPGIVVQKNGQQSN